MSSRSWPLVAVMLLCACVAFGCAAYVLAGGTGARFVLAGLGISVGLAILVFAVLVSFQSSDVNALRHHIRSEVAGFERKMREDRTRGDGLARELSDLKETSNRTNSAIATGFGELRNSYEQLSEQLRTTMSTVTNFQTARTFAAQMGRPAAYAYADAHYEPSFAQSNFSHRDINPNVAIPPDAYDDDDYPQPANDEFVDQPAKATTAAVDSLIISLEPVVDLFTSRTAHYRLHLGMTKPEGGDVAQDVLLHHADRTGLRSDFDVFAAREALPLLDKLRQRDPELNIFMSIGTATLQSATALDRILDEMQIYGEAARGLVIELPHAMLAGLPDAGLEGLARLARSGVMLSLSNVAMAGVDLPTLAQLNVRFLSLSAVSVGGVEGPTQATIQFTQAARAARIHTIVTGVVDRRVVSKLTKMTRFASGPAFAEPRRIKSDVPRHANISAAA